VKLGALLAILVLDPQFSIDLQLIGGVIMLQTLPAVAIGLYTRWFHRWALVAGWALGMAAGMAALYTIPNAASGHAHFGGSAFQLAKLGFHGSTVTIYAGFVALVVNLVVCAVGTVLLRAGKVADGVDVTREADYHADEGDPRVRDLPEVVGAPGGEATSST
jgi:solute:Na+ symporter, SSS family